MNKPKYTEKGIFDRLEEPNCTNLILKKSRCEIRSIRTIKLSGDSWCISGSPRYISLFTWHNVLKCPNLKRSQLTSFPRDGGDIFPEIMCRVSWNQVLHKQSVLWKVKGMILSRNYSTDHFQGPQDEAANMWVRKYAVFRWSCCRFQG